MDAPGIVRVLQKLGIRVNPYQGHECYDNIICHCPLIWRHKNGYDHHPSCSIKVEPGGTSVFNCFSASCGAKGTLSAMVMEVYRRRGRPDDLRAFVEEVISVEKGSLASVGSRLTRAMEERQKDLAAEVETRDVWNEREIRRFLGKIPKYAVERGITKEAAKRWELGYDKIGKRLLFPIRRRGGELVGVTGRAISPDVEPKYYNYLNFPRNKYLYGEVFFEDGAPLVLVEGPIDAIRVQDVLGDPYRVAALLGGFFSTPQLDTVLACNPSEIFLFFDGDAGGRSIIDSARPRLRERYPRVKTAKCPEGHDPGSLSREEIQTAIEQAKVLPEVWEAAKKWEPSTK